MERLIAAFGTGGAECYFAPSNFVPLADYRAQLSDPAVGFVRLLTRCEFDTKDPWVLNTCGGVNPSILLMAAQINFAVVHRNYLDAMDILESWLALVYYSAPGVLGQQPTMPIDFEGISFLTFEPLNGRFVPTARPVGGTTGTGSFWAAEQPVKAVWKAA